MKTSFIILSIVVVHISIAQQTNQDFMGFCTNFFKDSTYQLSHIQFPLTKVSRNFKEEKYDTTQLNRFEWRYSDFGFFHNNYNVQVYDNFTKTFRDSKERMLSFEGVQNGIDLNLCFILINDNWFLIRIEELSD